MKLFITPIVLLGLSISLMPTIASAQYDNSSFGNSGDNRDPFNRANSGDTSGLLNLINQAQINRNTNPNYSNEQRDRLNTATEDFRASQLRALRERNKKTNAAPVVAPK